tara:strand:- start:6981 stop:7169 length:189 start_codon:yes stop_codon:yes gene_type:complete
MISTFLTTGLHAGMQFRSGLQPAGLQQWSAIATDDMVMLNRASVANVFIGISPRVVMNGRID